eukprot:1518871-Prymnesium_polylepis.1
MWGVIGARVQSGCGRRAHARTVAARCARRAARRAREGSGREARGEVRESSSRDRGASEHGGANTALNPARLHGDRTDKENSEYLAFVLRRDVCTVDGRVLGGQKDRVRV